MDGVPDDGSSTFSFIQTTTFSYAVRAISKRNVWERSMDASIPPQIRGDGHTNHCATYVRFLATNYIVSQGFGILMRYERDDTSARGQASMARLERFLNGNICFFLVPEGTEYGGCGHPENLHDKRGFCAVCRKLKMETGCV